jgi:hypothetical protein
MSNPAPTSFARAVATATLLVALGSFTAAAAEIDPNSPRGAMKAFYQAMEAGDPTAVRAALYAADAQEKQLADAYAAQLTAAKALGDAAKNKFGAAGDALGKGLPLKDEIAKLADAAETVTGETATLKLAGQPKPLRFIKADGRWRLFISDYAGASGDDLAPQVAVLNDMAAVFNAAATDISADKYPSAQEAQRALQQKLQAVLFNSLRKHPPTTAKSKP